MFGIGPLEFLMIFVVALLVFGPKRVPELARTLGRGMAEFRRASNELRQSLALDEVQQDLRRNLTEHQTIHRPKPKPEAVAGAGEADSKTAAAAGGEADSNAAAAAGGEADSNAVAAAGGEADSNAAAAAGGEADSKATTGTEAKAHPGELPLGNDHEHHDEDDAPDANSAADPELGNVPVTGANPTDSRRG